MGAGFNMVEEFVNREQAIDQARDAVKRLEAQTKTWRGPCRECKWVTGQIGEYVEYDECGHPAELAAAFDPAMGLAGGSRDCIEVRSPTGICGPDGLMFEPKQKPFARLFAWMLGSSTK